MVLPVILISAAVFAVLFFPPLGALVGVLAPAPLIFVYLQRGQVVGLILMGLVFIVLMLLAGPAQAMLFAAEYVVMATILAETVKAQLTMDKCIFLSALGSMVLATFFLFVLFGGETSLIEFFQLQIMKHFDLSMEALKSMGENQADLDSMQEVFEGNLADICFRLSGLYHGRVAGHSGGQFFSGSVCLDPALRADPVSAGKVFRTGFAGFSDMGADLILGVAVFYRKLHRRFGHKPVCFGHAGLFFSGPGGHGSHPGKKKSPFCSMGAGVFHDRDSTHPHGVCDRVGCVRYLGGLQENTKNKY